MTYSRVLAATVLVVCFLVACPAGAQVYDYSIVYSSCNPSNCGGGSWGNVIQGTDGNLYGTNSGGGAYGEGAVFKMTLDGAVTILHSFCATKVNDLCTDGANPFAGLVLATDGNYYGTTAHDGSGAYAVPNAGGTVFQITPAGVFTTLYNFCSQKNCTDGGTSLHSMIQGTDGNLYGSTQYGGAQYGTDASPYGEGTLFKMSLAGSLTTLYVFCTNTACIHGADPGVLLLAPNGNIYGITAAGGTSGGGTFFQITSSGDITTIYTFDSSLDGVSPSDLILGSDGNFYGTASSGGTGQDGGAAHLELGGTLFKMTPTGTLTALYNFCTAPNCTDGSEPVGLMQASDGNFYGVTTEGGAADTLEEFGWGTVFRATPTGELNTLYTFCTSTGDCSNGGTPFAPMIEATDGILYGTVMEGASNGGFVYQITGVGSAKQNSAVTFSAMPYPISVGQTATLTATVTGGYGAPTGTVTFTSGSATLCSGTLANGVASCTVATNTLPPGSYQVTAQYSGNLPYNTSTTTVSATLNAAATSTTLTASPTSVPHGAIETLTVTVARSAAGATGAPTGTVSFYAGSTYLGYLELNSSGVAVLQESTADVPAGMYAITARYNGDADDSKSTSAIVDVTVQ